MRNLNCWRKSVLASADDSRCAWFGRTVWSSLCICDNTRKTHYDPEAHESARPHRRPRVRPINSVVQGQCKIYQKTLIFELKSLPALSALEEVTELDGGPVRAVPVEAHSPPEGQLMARRLLWANHTKNDDVHAPILSACLFRIIGGYRMVLGVPGGGEPFRRETVLRNQ